jgi:diaminopropionate ammonia-lyase
MLPDYTETPLVDVPPLACELGVGRLFVKDEHARLGLPSFKGLGAAWAVWQALRARVPGWSWPDGPPDPPAGVRDLVGAVTLIAATDGNHGLAVARFARSFGLEARILVPRGLASGRVAAIRGEGAAVQVVDGSYDDAVRESARLAATSPQFELISDTAWPGYEQVPTWVVEGYGTIFDEIDEQLPADVAIDAVFVPVGVGGLASAAVARYGAETTRIITVEPMTAACLALSLQAGRRVAVPGPHPSIMAGLNCGEVSTVAWGLLRTGVDVACTIRDEQTLQAMRDLAKSGIESGESGAASLAGARQMLAARDIREAMGIGVDAAVLLLNTEGNTASTMAA